MGGIDFECTFVTLQCEVAAAKERVGESKIVPACCVSRLDFHRPLMGDKSFSDISGGFQCHAKIVPCLVELRVLGGDPAELCDGFMNLSRCKKRQTEPHPADGGSGIYCQRLSQERDGLGGPSELEFQRASEVKRIEMFWINPAQLGIKGRCFAEAAGAMMPQCSLELKVCLVVSHVAGLLTFFGMRLPRLSSFPDATAKNP